MGLGRILSLFTGGAKSVTGIVETFRPNAEASAARSHSYDTAAFSQYAAEFQARARRTWFDSFVDGMNRLVRPTLTYGIGGMIGMVAISPKDMAEIFATLELVPDPLWMLSGIIVPFYFGGRMQIKSHDYRASFAAAAARAPQVIENIKRLRSHLTPGDAADDSPQVAHVLANDRHDNAAINAWLESGGSK